MRATRWARLSVRRTTRALVWPLAALALGAVAAAQSAPASTPAHKTVRHRKPRPADKPVVAVVTPPTPVQPPKPNWPVNDKAIPATISWDAHSLRIQASNSSLLEILAQVMSTTGTRIEGASSDQRIFGTFGPGSARDVLSELLSGSGYNVLMMGESELGVPREVQLSQRRIGGPTMPGGGSPRPATLAPPDDDPADDAPPPEPEPEPQPPAPQPEQRPQGPTPPGQAPPTQPN